MSIKFIMIGVQIRRAIRCDQLCQCLVIIEHHTEVVANNLSENLRVIDEAYRVLAVDSEIAWRVSSSVIAFTQGTFIFTFQLVFSMP